MLNKPAIIPKRQKLIVYIVLTFITLAVYWQVNQSDFINLEDNIYVTENSHIHSGITPEGIRWAFSTTYAEFWHPLTWLSLILDFQFYGLNAGGYHVTNLVLHILTTLLLFWLFNRMTKQTWTSAFVAAFFAFHPLHVESVVWVSERKDVLSAFFWMLTLCFYVYYTEKPDVRRYLLVVLSFVLALMSKPIVITLPVIMILLDYWPLSRCHIGIESQKGNLILWQLKEKILFFVLSAIFSIITIHAQTRPSLKSIPLSDRSANALISFIAYLKKIFWPFDLAIFYPTSEQIHLWQILGTLLLILAISTFVIVTVKRLPYLFVGWLWYAITILPVLGITYTGVHWMHDTYTYLPSIGISIMLAWGISVLFKSENMRKNILLPAALFILTILSCLAWRQCGYWKNSIELFSHNLRITNNNYLAYDHRGIAYGQTGQYQRAIDDFSKSIDLKPDYYKGYNNRGFAYFKIGQYQYAFEDYNEAISLKPDYAKAYNNRAIAYLSQGDNISGCNDAQNSCALGDCSTLQTAQKKGLCY